MRVQPPCLFRQDKERKAFTRAVFAGNKGRGVWVDERQYDFKSRSLKNSPKPRAKLLWLGRPVLPFRTLGSD